MFASQNQIQKIQALLQTGLAAQQAGRAAEAEKAYRQVLALNPRQPDALQLWGLLAKSLGQNDQARELMQRSLAIQPRQPNVWSNLGNLVLGMGDAVQALDCYDKALVLSPRDPQLHFNRAKALDALAETGKALDSLDKALHHKPDYAPAISLRASLLLQQGALQDAELAARKAIALRPDDARSWNNLGLALRRQDRYGEAEPAYRQALAINNSFKEVWLNLGNVLIDLDQQEEALAAYRHALALDPFYGEAHENLARQLWRMGRTAEAGASYETVAQAYPDDPRALSLLANGKLLFGLAEDALKDLEQAMALGAVSAQHTHLKARLLLRVNRPAEALTVLEGLVAASPDNIPYLQDLATAQFRNNDPAGAARTAAAILERDAQAQFGLAYLGTAQRMLGDPAADWLYDYDNSIAIIDLPAPPFWENVDAFLDALRAIVKPLHNTERAPLHLTLKHGSQTTGNLLEVHRDGPIGALRETILAAISRFINTLPPNPDHPFHGRALTCKNLQITGSWSSRLADGGYHTHHIHTDGWISGVYYIDVPPVVADDESKEGWLTFGKANIGPEIDLPFVKAVQPKPGRMVLFPSFVWHGTVPFHDKTNRITIAFDITPTS